MRSNWLRQFVHALGWLLVLGLYVSTGQARPVTGTVSGTGGAGGCTGNQYFCSVGAQSIAPCESFTTLDVDCVDVLNIPNSDEAARQAQRAFNDPLAAFGAGLPTSVTGTGLRLIASIQGTGGTIGPAGEAIEVFFGGGGLTLRVRDHIDSPLLLALRPTPDSVSYLLLDDDTSFDAFGSLTLNLNAAEFRYHGLTLYQATNRVSEPGDAALVLLALALAGLAARRRRG